MKKWFAGLLAALLVLAALVPAGAVAEDLILEPMPDEIALEEDGIELPTDFADIDLPFDDAIVLDDLQLLQGDSGESEEKAHTTGEEASDGEAQDTDSNATKYGVPTTLTLGVKETYAIKCTKSGKLTYKTSSKKVATVSSKGVVTGKKAGNATITVYRNKKKLTTCKVKVVAAPKKVTLSKTKLTLQVKGTYRLTAKITSGSHAKLTWSSSNKKVATVSASGLVTAKKAGTATITVKTHNGKKATCKVTVKKATASTLRVSPTSLTLSEGEARDATVTFTVDGSVRWSTSNESVATCAWTSGWNGDDTTLTVYGNSAGTAVITLTNDANSDTATLKVTVKAPEEEYYGDGTLSVNPTSMSMAAGESRDATVTFTVDGSVTWSSSNESVADCAWTSGWNGDDTTLTVYGRSAGTAVITLTNDANYDTATLKVTVTQAASAPEPEVGDSTVKYRALLIGEENFSPICTRNRGDVTLMKNMLNSIKGPAGGQYSVTCKYDLSRTGTLNAIKSAFSGADDNDVSLFFIASHGDSESTGSEAGALAMIGSTYEEKYLLMPELASALKAVPGKVIIIIESCGSGASIYASGVTENSAGSLRNASEAFDGAVIRAFSSADPGIRVSAPSHSVSKGALAPNTGELRVENKFYVLTATRYHEDSWGTESGPYNYFTKWLTDGIGTSGRMPADANTNGETTLSELFSYISNKGDSYPFRDSGTTYYQHVQVYPKNSAYALFRR